MLKLKRKESVFHVSESSKKSISSLVREILDVLGKMNAESKEQEAAIQKATQLIKRVPYLQRKDREDGTDRAFDACNDSTDALFKTGIRGDTLRLIDDLIDLVQA